MNELICEMCGSNNVVKQDGLFICQNCNTKYSIEEAKKIMFGEKIEVEGTVKIDHSSELTNLYELARRAKESNNDENVLKYYDQILLKDANSWEAQFYVVYYRTMQCKIAEISNSTVDLTNSLNPVFDLIKENISEEEYSDTLQEITDKMLSISVMLFNASFRHYNQIRGAIVKAQQMPTYHTQISRVMKMLNYYGDLVISTFGEEYSEFAVSAWKQSQNILKSIRSQRNTRNFGKKEGIYDSYVEKIAKYDPTFVVPKKKKFGLF